MKFDPIKHHRRSTRLREYDYAREGTYFVTICTYEREYLFGDVVDGAMRLNEVGDMANQCWLKIPGHFENVRLDEFQVMPNHVHGIVVLIRSVGTRQCRGVQLNAPTENPGGISPKSGSLSVIVRTFKAAVTSKCRENGQFDFKWQRNYHDRIIRSRKELQNIRNYIRENPAKWEIDEENPINTG